MISSKDALGQCVEPIFHTLASMQRDAINAAEASALYERCVRELDQLQTQANQREIPSADLEGARYAMVALIDEIAVQREGALKDYWLPRVLQMKYFGENVAGDHFFDRLTALRGDVKRHQVLRVYYLCMLFGFRGKYRLRGSELELLEIEESVRTELQKARVIPTELSLSPSGRRPHERFADARRNQLLLTIA
ncbi:MAG TPA: DotU family type IV/VI secretion system protein, partial [Polyangiales bacterium]